MRKFYLLGLMFVTVLQTSGQALYTLGPTDFNQPSYFAANHTSIAADLSGNIYTAYVDGGNGNKVTVEKYSSGNWSVVGAAGFSPSNIKYVNVAVTLDGILYVVYQTQNASDSYAYDATVMKYASGVWSVVGSSNFAKQLAFDNGFPDYFPNIKLAVAPDGTPYVAYQDYDASFPLAATVKKFDGSNWITVGTQGFTGTYSASAVQLSFTISRDGVPFIFFEDNGPNPVVASSGTVMKFDGSNWVLVGTEGFTSSAIAYPSIAVASDGNPYVAYQDVTHIKKVSVMLFNGSNWINVGTTGFSTGEAQYVSLAVDADDKPYVAYRDVANSNRATVKNFDGGSWVNYGNSIVSGAVQSTNLLIDSLGKISVIYSDASINSKAVVKQFVDPDWVILGSGGLSGGPATNTSLDISSTNEVYVAYKDNQLGGKVSVSKYSSSLGGWSVVNSPGFSDGNANFVSLALSPTDNTPYVAYQDGANSDKLTVSYLASDGWGPVGSTGISAGTADDISLSFSPSGVPYVSFTDGANSDRLTVMSYNGFAWATVGSAGFSTGNIAYTSMAMASDGTPYIAYYDFTVGKAVVKKFTGSWVDVGSAGGLSSGVANYISLAINSTGIPFIAYQNGVNGKIVVQSYNGTTWSIVGIADFSAGSASYISLSFDGSNNPIVAYRDGSIGGKLTLKGYSSGSWATLVAPQGVSAGSVSDVSIGFASGNIYMAYTDGYAWVKAFGDVPLPVQLVEFSAHKENSTVRLQWETASEFNSDYFIIEHSTNGNNFAEIGRVAASKNSTQLKQYNFVHLSPQIGKNYYRLKQVDLDGKTYFSQVRIVSFEEKESISVFVYPNPVINSLTLKTDAFVDFITITNSLGQTLIRKDIHSSQQSFQIDVSSLKNGTYYLSLFSKQGQKTVGFVKN